MVAARADLAAELTRDGIAASDGPPPAGAIVVAAAADSSGDPHLAVLAGTRGPVTTWTSGSRIWIEQTHRAALTRTRPPRAGIAGSRFVKVPGAGNHGMFYYLAPPQRLPIDGEFAAEECCPAQA